MIIPDLKSRVTTMIGSRRDSSGEMLSSPVEMKAEKSMTEPGEPDERHIAAGDLISAIHEKSPQKLMEALSNFIDLHQIHTSKGSKEE